MAFSWSLEGAGKGGGGERKERTSDALVIAVENNLCRWQWPSARLPPSKITLRQHMYSIALSPLHAPRLSEHFLVSPLHPNPIRDQSPDQTGSPGKVNLDRQKVVILIAHSHRDILRKIMSLSVTSSSSSSSNNKKKKIKNACVNQSQSKRSQILCSDKMESTTQSRMSWWSTSMTSNPRNDERGTEPERE